MFRPALSTVRQVRLYINIFWPHISDWEIVLDIRLDFFSHVLWNSCRICHMSDPVTYISLVCCILGLVLIWNQCVLVFQGFNCPDSSSLLLLRNSGNVHSERHSEKTTNNRQFTKLGLKLTERLFPTH